jgi:hypothetical protein
MYSTDESPAPVCSDSTAWTRSQCPRVPTLAAGISNGGRTEAERTENLVTRFDEVNGDDGFIKLKMRMTLRRKSLRLSRGCSMEFPIFEVGLPVTGFKRGLATRLGFEERPQHHICRGKFEEWHHTKSALVGLGGRKRSPTLPSAEDGALVSDRS